MLPVLPATMTSPWLVYVTSQPAGLKPAFVVKLPCLNCSTIVIIPLESVLTVNSRLNVSSAQSLPHVPESGESLGYGHGRLPELWPFAGRPAAVVKSANRV